MSSSTRPIILSRSAPDRPDRWLRRSTITCTRARSGSQLYIGRPTLRPCVARTTRSRHRGGARGTGPVLSPIGYQTNMMVYGFGGFRFRDDVRLGWILAVTVVSATVMLTPMLWAF